MPTLTLTTVNVGTPDPVGLARFYERLLGWSIAFEEPGFVIVRDPAGGMGVSFQLEEGHVPPTWPAQPGDQQMQLHLEIKVDDLEGAQAFAVECGATVAEFQPQDDVRVCLDPAGHPFCLFLH
jgi:catechol 2,3-dioxygenase-like lactoylglutathione lyase family enzyme